MIKDGMWFEDESHYEFYREQMNKFATEIESIIAKGLAPLYERILNVLNRPA
jgi:hypothetical protein